MEGTSSSAAQSTVSAMMVGSSQSIVEYPVDNEVIDDESTDSEVERRNETKLRLQSIYDSQSINESLNELFPSIDTGKFRHCVVCEKPITDLVIWALNRPHHCKCLVCFVCKEPIGFRKFKVVEGKMLMCYKDYYESYQKCRVCQKSFEGKSALSYKKLYHKDCFKCVNCFDVVTAEGAVELFDEVYCPWCASCVSSKKIILQKYYELIGRNFRRRKEPDENNSSVSN